MIEILILIAFCKHLGALARSKNRSPAWAGLGVVGWIGGEVGGAYLGFTQGSVAMGLYGWAILGGAAGALVAYVAIRSLSTLPPADFPTARVV